MKNKEMMTKKNLTNLLNKPKPLKKINQLIIHRMRVTQILPISNRMEWLQNKLKYNHNHKEQAQLKSQVNTKRHPKNKKIIRLMKKKHFRNKTDGNFVI